MSLNSEIINRLSQYGVIEENVSFKTMTTFRVGGLAAAVIYPKNYFSIVSILDILKDNSIPFKVFGNGSNILCSDDYFEGVIIRLSRSFNEYYFDEDYLYAQAGCSIISLAYKALENGLSGLEFASGIPATLGGAIYMNAGAYKSEMKDIIEEVQVLIDDDLVWLNKQQCEFAYRTSIFQHHPNWIILNCKIKLAKGNKDEILELMKKRQAKRLQSQPLEYPSAGSTFRNKEGIFAWQLIDQIGYRGKRVNGAMVSEKHSNFIINYDNASSSDIMELANQIIAKVKEEYGIDMIMEVEKFNWK